MFRAALLLSWPAPSFAWVPATRPFPSLGSLRGTCSSSRGAAHAAAAGRPTAGRAALATRAAMPASSELPPRAKAVLDYWFGEGWEEAEPADNRATQMRLWFGGGPQVDAEIVQRFGADCKALIAGEYDSWAAQGSPQAALAAIVLGDQLCRNAFRGTAQMYAADPRVLGWAKGLMASGGDTQLLPIQRPFVYLPLMHSEVLEDQEDCIARYKGLAADCEAQGLADVGKLAQESIKYAQAHRDVVARWGRFPHRNGILGRENTPEEAEGIAAGTIPKW